METLFNYLSSKITLEHLAWTLDFLKNYPSEDTGAALWGVSNKTYCRYIWNCIDIIQSTLNQVSIILLFIVTDFFGRK